MAGSVSGFRDLLSDRKYWLQLHEAVGQFRLDGDLEAFFPKVNSVFDVVSLSIAHLQAILDQYPQYITGWQESYFMDDAAEALMATFRSHYDNHSFDLSDALGAMVDFMKKFGVHFVEKDTTHYCYVLDIQENG